MKKQITSEIAGLFAIYGEFINAGIFGSGHINDTFLSCWNQAGTKTRYIHQRINNQIFIHPDKVMENILRVTNHITNKNREAGVQDLSRHSLTVVHAKDGKPWARDAEGNWWRTYLFIEDSYTKDTASSLEEARFLGEGAGLFQRQLADLTLPRLHDTIPDFHNMEKRYLRFYEALKKDTHKRSKDAAFEIDFLIKNEERGAALDCALREGLIIERICHNDTKMNNILIDNKDSKALCMIDLDTVMPGTSLYDLGDLIRTAANRAAEDETDILKVDFDTGFYKSLLTGYLSQTLVFLTAEEKKLLAESGRNITQIMGLRFLTDFLEGDHYYHTIRPKHNLERCRTQIALIKSMDSKWETIQEITHELTNGVNSE